MKKIALYSLLVGTALLTACKGDYKDWSEPQHYDQADPASISLTAEPVGAIDLRTADDKIQIFKPSLVCNQECTTTYQAAIYNTDLTDSVVIAADANGVALRAEVQGALVALYGASEVQRATPMNITAISLINGTAVATRVQGVTLTATPKYQKLPEVRYILGTDVGLGTWVNSKRVGLYTSLVAMYPNPYNYDELIYASYFSDGSEFKIIFEAGNKDVYIGGGDENGGQSFQSEAPAEGTALGNVVVGKGGYYKVIVNVADIDNPTLRMEPITGDVKFFTSMSMPGLVENMEVITTAGHGENHDWLVNGITFGEGTLATFSGNVEGGGNISFGGNAFPTGKAIRNGNGIPCVPNDNGYVVVFNDLLGVYQFIEK